LSSTNKIRMGSVSVRGNSRVGSRSLRPSVAYD
jgi:hypothetical protein